jgi:hypothetical protein
MRCVSEAGAWCNVTRGVSVDLASAAGRAKQPLGMSFAGLSGEREAEEEVTSTRPV